LVGQFFDWQIERRFVLSIELLDLIFELFGFSAGSFGQQHDAPSFAQITPFEPAPELAPPNAAGIQTWFMVFAQGKEGPIEFNESHVCSPREHKFMRKEVVPVRGLGSAPGPRIEGV
jgi:hypothetical protein